MFYLRYTSITITIHSKYTAGKMFRSIDKRYAILGQHIHTLKFSNEVTKLPLNASKDIAAVLLYLPFVVKDLLGM